MWEPIGDLEQIVRYPVKSMAGEPLDAATLGWHGVEGDRRFAFRRCAEGGGFPWLTAGRVRELLQYRPLYRGENGVPTHVRTPDGRELELTGSELRDELAGRAGAEVELMRLRHGMFDDAPVSLIATTTVAEVERAAGRPVDIRRFRPNFVIRSRDPRPFVEDGWVGKVVRIGEAEDAPRVAVTMRDLRCLMINFDPDTAENDPDVMKTVVRLNANHAGVYGTVIRSGAVAVGATLYASVE